MPPRKRFMNYFGNDRRATALKPEYALDRADQLISVGQEETALMALYNIITDNTQKKRQWNVKYEGIMVKLMELCVKNRRQTLIKEALHKYRALCSTQNVASLEKVVRYLVKEGISKAEEARRSIMGEVVDDTGNDDLEELGMETTETLLLEAAGAEQSKERTDRQVVVPWMKFMWEVFRVVLDIVKFHSKLETCYHDMAKQGFAFCQKHNRFSEFRRLCDILRQHLSYLTRPQQKNANDVQLSNPETTQNFLETRFLQLQTSVVLRNWQEAYRTIEDIHMLISLAKKMPKAQTMGIYYERLTQVFWMSKNYLYHAHALYKLYSLNIKQNKSLSAEEAKNMATRLLLASLCVPPFDAHSAVLADSIGLNHAGDAAGENAARHARMAAILGYSTPALRSTLMDDIRQKKILEVCHDEVKVLVPILEVEMEPLKLSQRLKPALEFVASNPVLADYTEPLKRIAVFRLLEQLGKVYNVMKVSEVGKVASFTTVAEVERTALEALKAGSLSIRFDHQYDCIIFESSLFSTSAMKEQLMNLGKRLEVASKMWKLPNFANAEVELQARRSAAIQMARAMSSTEQDENLRRKNIIELRKEEQERQSHAAEMQRQAAIAKKKRDDYERTRQREEQEQRDRERQRTKEQEEQQRRQLGADQEAEQAAEEHEDSFEKRRIQLEKEKEEEIRAQREAEKKVAVFVEKFDFLERALREENKPLMTKVWNTRCEKQLAEHFLAKEALIAKKRTEHEQGLARKAVLVEQKDTIKMFKDALMKTVDDELEKLSAELREKEAREAQLRIEEEQRRREEQAREKQRREEEEQRRQEQRLEEEEQRRAEEAKAAEETAKREAELAKAREPENIPSNEPVVPLKPTAPAPRAAPYVPPQRVGARTALDAPSQIGQADKPQAPALFGKAIEGGWRERVAAKKRQGQNRSQ
eukprot:CAMPEP_0184745962 /NCGR_PEP_ID=MMETSP0315-20130426/8574_1 /TAXON_ID=101924 /ORGANISM="Rhodosorus marinus, Strain UTEX LB 2760" /LENGTH=929 /DNA_ID=CAMNT_0027218337 /DNA_START=98 /DNA_END=2887 /DNA_ORIENTATION=+